MLKKPYGRIARFTWRNNYQYLSERLKDLLSSLSAALGINIKSRISSNYTSIPEKVLCAAAGLAEYGRNSVLLNESMGSFFVIGEALADLEVDFRGTKFEDYITPRVPDYAICGDCNRCREACPTGAIISDGVLDVGRCLQYLSENLVPIPRAFREVWGNRLYGCTTCLDVCPFNDHLACLSEMYETGYVGQGMDLLHLLSMSSSTWTETFRNNQISIRNPLAIIQNALICIGNLAYQPALSVIEGYLLHENPVIRSTAAWSVGSLNCRGGLHALKQILSVEKNGIVRSEIEYFL